MESTPDHWHSIPTVLGLEAGKHVYVAKPFALTVREGRAMAEAARCTKRILFPGTQHRSAPHIAAAARMVRSGEIGDVSFVRVWNSGNIAPDIQRKVPDSDPPPGLDWDFYLGPSPRAPFNRMRFLTKYRVFSVTPAATLRISAIIASIAYTRSWAPPARIRVLNRFGERPSWRAANLGRSRLLAGSGRLKRRLRAELPATGTTEESSPFRLSTPRIPSRPWAAVYVLRMPATSSISTWSPISIRASSWSMRPRG